MNNFFRQQMAWFLIGLLLCAWVPFQAAAAETPGGRSADDVFAILYMDGTLAFQNGNMPDGREFREIYPVDINTCYTVLETQDPNTPWFDDRLFVQKVDFVDRISPKCAAFWFYKMENLKEVNHSENFDLSDCSRITDLFYGCKNLKTVDVSSWDTQQITDARGLFSGCSSLTELDVSGFGTQNVKDFSSMFRGCSNLTQLDVSCWDTSQAEQLGSMFEGCSNLTELDLSGWDTARCFHYGNMFRDAVKLRTIWASEKFVLDHDAVMGSYSTRGTGTFANCTSLAGSNGTAYDPDHTDYTYLRIDSEGAPGYLSQPGLPALQLSDTLPLMQTGSPVSRASLGSLKSLTVRLDSTSPESSGVIFAAAFYDSSGKMLKAFLARKTVLPGTEAVTIPASAVSKNARSLQVFALSEEYAPLTGSRRFRLE